MTAAAITVTEPGGARELGLPLSLGDAPAQVRVPGAAAGERVTLNWIDGAWQLTADAASSLRINGERAGGARELRAGDAFSLGSALCSLRLRGGQWQLDVRHSVANETAPPLAAADRSADADDEGDAEIVATVLASSERVAPATGSVAGKPRHRAAWAIAATIILIAAAGTALLGNLQRVSIDVEPADARVVANSLLSWHSGTTLFVLPGTHRVRAERAGFRPAERELQVLRDQPLRVALQLSKLPGILSIDTGGVAATVTVDGAELGKAPGDIEVAAGKRTITLRADRYLDAVQQLEVEGGGVRQPVTIRLQSSWGRVAVSATVVDASVVVDGGPAARLPATIDLPAGVHRLQITASNARPWESSVLVKAGQTSTIGPITLGAPDARLTVRSQPAGAEVIVAGTFRGRTPLEVAMPPGAEYSVALVRAGYAPWSRTLAPKPAERISLDARLQARFAALTIAGEPRDAQVVVDGKPQGTAPLTLQLLATRQRVEVRKEGMQSYTADVDLSSGLARTLDYTLIAQGRPADWKPPAATITSKLGQTLRLIAAGSFTMGSDRREQGRRPNESQRKITLSRPFYIASREVTNGDYRRFEARHASGVVDGRTIDLDGQAVTGVSWDEAVTFCNWLSEQDNLPVAYELVPGGWKLKSPATIGYRLPTEAEWEYAARYAPRAMRRYEWGDALPVPANVGNLAGLEARSAVQTLLEGYRDEYPSVAPPGKYAPNALALFDMTGNVSEWTNDRYSSVNDSAAATDPLGPAEGTRRVVKGSSWRTATFADLRLAWRDSASAADTRTQDLGFRIARYAE